MITKDNITKDNYIVAQMNEIVRSYGDVFKVAATIYGVKYLLDEYQVRALQIMCQQAAEQSDEAWQEFVDNVIVYNTYAKLPCSPEDSSEPFDFTDYDGNPQHVHKMIFRKDGIFDNDFSYDEYGYQDNGFYSRAGNMAFDLV